MLHSVPDPEEWQLATRKRLWSSHQHPQHHQRSSATSDQAKVSGRHIAKAEGSKALSMSGEAESCGHARELG